MYENFKFYLHGNSTEDAHARSDVQHVKDHLLQTINTIKLIFARTDLWVMTKIWRSQELMSQTNYKIEQLWNAEIKQSNCMLQVTWYAETSTLIGCSRTHDVTVNLFMTRALINGSISCSKKSFIALVPGSLRRHLRCRSCTGGSIQSGQLLQSRPLWWPTCLSPELS